MNGIVNSHHLVYGNQGEVVLTNNGVAGSTVDLGLQTTDSPTFAGLTSGDVTIQGKLTKYASKFKCNPHDKKFFKW